MKKNTEKKKDETPAEVDTAAENVADSEEVIPAVEAVPVDEGEASGDGLPDAGAAEDAGTEDEEADLDPLEAEILALREERDDLKDQALRARAEFDNYRKRMARESDRIRKTAAEGLMRDLLPIVDNLERALSHVEDKSDGLAQGVEMIVKQFADVLGAKGLEPIPAKGEPFDPNIHEALTHQPSEAYPADVVMEEFQRGYRLGDYVLRPTQVVVSSGPAAPAEDAPESGPPEAAGS